MLNFKDFLAQYNNKFWDLSGRMNPSMFRASKNHKVLDSIINLIMVNMMNNFRSFKFSSKILFHNISMFFHFFTSRYKNTHIPALNSFSTSPIRMSFSLHMFYLAFSRTINQLSFLMAFIISKFFFTIVALKNTFPRFVITFSITKPSMLTRRGLKFFRTLFANVFHSYNFTGYTV